MSHCRVSRFLAAASLCALLPAQDSKPTAASAPTRLLFPKHDFSLVPPAGWKIEHLSDAAGSKESPHQLVCSVAGTEKSGVLLRITQRQRLDNLDAHAMAASVARAHLPPAKVLEAKNLKISGDEAAIYSYEAEPPSYESKIALCTLVCIVQGEEGAVEFHVNGSKNDIQRWRKVLDDCFTSVRIGAWAIPGARFKHPWHPLTLVPPEGWREVGGASGNTWSLAPLSEEKVRPMLTITTQDAQKDFAMSRLRTAYEAAQKKANKDFSIVTGKEITILGRKAAFFRGKYKLDDKPMAHLCWVILTDPRIYVIGWTCKEAELVALQPSIDACVATLEIGKEGTEKGPKR